MSSDEAVDAGQKAYHHGDLRRAIIDTALDTLQEQQGWQFTLREIARRANVSHSAPYRHFPDKAALLHELALIGFDRLNEDLAASVDRAADAPDVLRALAYAHLAFGQRNPDLYRLMFAADAGRPRTSISIRACRRRSCWSSTSWNTGSAPARSARARRSARRPPAGRICMG